MNARLVVLALLVLVVAPPARAGILDWSVGVKGGAGVDVWLAPSATPTWTSRAPLFDASRAGWTYGGGVFAELRILKFLGIEADFLFFHNVIKEDTSWNGGLASSEERVEWTTMRIPILVKGVLPLGIVRLSLGVGPEFAIGLDASASTSGPLSLDLSARTVTDTYLALGLGVAIALGPISIPIDLRFSYNLTKPTAYEDLVDVAIDGVTITAARLRAGDSMNALLLVGVAYEF